MQPLFRSLLQHTKRVPNSAISLFPTFSSVPSQFSLTTALPRSFSTEPTNSLPETFFDSNLEVEEEWKDRMGGAMDVFGASKKEEGDDAAASSASASEEQATLTLKEAFERYGLDLIKTFATPKETEEILSLLTTHLAPESASRIRGFVLNGFEGKLMDDGAYQDMLENVMMTMADSDWKYTLYKRLVDSMIKKSSSSSSSSRHFDEDSLLGPDSMVRALKHKQTLEKTGGESTWQEEETKALLSYSNPLEDKFKMLESTPGTYLKRCKGAKQQRGNKVRTCHLVDLNVITYANIPELTRFLGGTGKILDRKRTGLCAKCQRRVRKVIKQSRWMGFLPFTQEALYVDMRRYDVRKVSKTSVDGCEVIVSKTM
jgi:small subunit ribosomal protein S18